MAVTKRLVGIDGAIVPDVSNNKIQSGAPSWLAPGVDKLCVPEFENGDPAIVENVPLDGSYHRARTEPENLARFTVRVVLAGQ